MIIDVQEFFLAQVDARRRSHIEKNMQSFVRLLAHFRVPVLVTLERPVDYKGVLPAGMRKYLGDLSETFEKDYFDLTKEKKIRNFLRRSGKEQVVVVGCETDVCVLQSCLGLLDLGYELFVVEDLVFSSSDDVEAAIARMQTKGAIFLTYKTLYYELVAAVEGGQFAEVMLSKFGPFPVDLQDFVAE